MSKLKKCVLCECFASKGDFVWHVKIQGGKRGIAHDHCLDNDCLRKSRDVIIKDTGSCYVVQ